MGQAPLPATKHGLKVLGSLSHRDACSRVEGLVNSWLCSPTAGQGTEQSCEHRLPHQLQGMSRF